MPANLESMAYFKETPWHGLGVPLSAEDCLSVDATIKASGLDWDVGVAPLILDQYTDEELTDENKPETVEKVNQKFVGRRVLDKRVVYRKTDGSILGVVGERYHPVPNLYKFKWFQPFLDAKEAEFHTAGSLFGGRKVWILAQLNRDPVKITKNDEVLKFILLSDSFDGSSAVRAGFTPIRVVCANTLAMAHGNDASKLIRLKHSKSVKDNLEKVREIMNAADAKFTATAEQYKALTRKDVSARDLKNFVELVLKVPDDTDNISTRMRNILQKVYDHFETEGGKTWWHAYNSVNTYLNHDKGKRENRVNGLWFGQDAKTNQDALNLALKMAGV